MQNTDMLPGGCAILAFLLWLGFGLAWITFLIWAGVNIVNWLVTK